jgi:hypothetical protein
MQTSRYNTLTQLAAVMAGFALTILLIESEGLQRWAQRLEVGPAAMIATRATGDLHRVLQPLNIEWIRRESLADLDRLGWSDDPARLQAAERLHAPGVTGHVQQCAATATTASLSVPRRSAEILPHSAPIPLQPSTPVSTPLPPLSAIIQGHPRVIALAGDSMMAVGLSDVLLRETAADPNLRVIKAFKSGTGLARPDVFDWTEEYPAMLGGEHPDAVIVAIGANDGQGFIEDGKVLAFGSDAWIHAYQDRVAEFLGLLTQDGARVVWVGLPPMKSFQYDQKAALINRIAYSVVRTNPQATWWNPLPYIGDESGAYREFQTTPEGRTTRLRAPDGIHLSDEGAMLLSTTLINWLNAPPPSAAAQAPPPVPVKIRARRVSRRKARL